MYPEPILIHGTCVALGGNAAVLMGPSGSGKSDLALRFIHETPSEYDPALVADDQIIVTARNGKLFASPPETIAGRIEMRGVGILTLPFRAEARIRLFVTLTEPAKVPRLPPESYPEHTIHGIGCPIIALAPFEVSAALKLRYALKINVQ